MKTTGKLIIFIFALLTLGANAYAADDSPLFEAVKKGDKAEVEALLAKGADVNARNTNTPGMTPLIEAAVEGRKDMVELLLAKGADVNAKSKDGRAPLHWMAYGGKGTKDMAELLLAKGADVNAKDTADERTPLHWVAYIGEKDMAELLLANGADVNAKDTQGMTPFDWAVLYEKKDVLELMENHVLKQTKNPRELFGQLTQQLKDKPDYYTKQVYRVDTATWVTQQLKDKPGDSTRRLIIRLASELKPAPAISEEARKHFVEGTAIVKAAKNPAQQALAAQSFTEALKIAPWWGDAYYNLGVAQELAENYDGAEQAFNFYLLSNPGATEKREVQDRIYGLSAKRKLAGVK